MTAFAVVMVESTGATDLTPYVSDLSFRSIDPGGFGSATFNLSRKIDARDFEDQADILIYNAETGSQVSGGRLVDPGRGISASGEQWEMSVLGEGVAHMQERKEPYILRDVRTDVWRPTDSTNPGLEWSKGTAPDTTVGATGGTSGLRMDVKTTASVAVNDYADITYADLAEFPGARIATYEFSNTAGRNSTSHRTQSLRQLDSGTKTVVSDDPWTLSLNNVDEEIAATPANKLILRYERDVNGFTSTSDDWTYCFNISLTSVRLDRNGVAITGAGLSGSIFIEDIVVDCWARFCPRFDVPNASIVSSGGNGITGDWAFADGITPYDVFGKLMETDPGHTWAVWEKQNNGLFRAEWREYDLDVRYEITSEAGFSETGTATRYSKVYGSGHDDDQFSIVSYTDADPLLESRGIYPTNTYSDSGELYLYTNVLEGLLDDSGIQSSNSQVTLATKAFDHYTGRWVEPFEVLPGYLARVSGVSPRNNVLNVGQPDGAAVFRVASNDYSTTSASSRLELNGYTMDERRAIANLLAARR